MHVSGVSFSIANSAAWAPGVGAAAAWQAWAAQPFPLAAGADPALAAMPAMLRRRAGFQGKMALEVAYQCLEGRRDVPVVFCSRHGDVLRAVQLLGDLVQQSPLSPTAFGMAVHNASAGLFSIARSDRANHLAVAAGAASIEHAVIEACGLLADGAPLVLLVCSECPVPPPFEQFRDCDEQAHAFAWLMAPAGEADTVHLAWQAAASSHGGISDVTCADAGARGAMHADTGATATRGPDASIGTRANASANVCATDMSPGLALLQFYYAGAAQLQRVVGRRQWQWSRAGADRHA